MTERTSTAPREIKALIEDALYKVNACTALAHATYETTRQTQVAMQPVHALITDVSTPADKQSKGVAEVNAAVAESNGLTQQYAAMLEELAAAAQSMRGRTEVMTQAVPIFQG